MLITCLVFQNIVFHNYIFNCPLDAAKVMWFEKAYAWLWFIERNIVYPVIFLSALTSNAPTIVKKFGV